MPTWRAARAAAAARGGRVLAVGDIHAPRCRAPTGSAALRRHFAMVVDFDRNGIDSNSFVAHFPADRIDPGPRAGQMPTNPMLVNGPVVNRDLLNQLYPPGQAVRNTGVVWLDSPDRTMPSIQQVSLGYQRQLGSRTSVSADYVHTAGRGLFMVQDLNAGVRATTSPGSPIVRPDPEFLTSVNTRSNVGEYDYDGLNVQLEKRESNGWSGRVSCGLGSGLAASDSAEVAQSFNSTTVAPPPPWFSGACTYLSTSGWFLRNA